MTPSLRIPFVTREIDFACRHFDLVEELYQSEQETEAKRLNDLVLSRAGADAKILFEFLQEEVSTAVKGIVRIDWVSIRGKSFENRGRVFNSIGRKRRLGSMGFMLGWNATAMRFFGWMWPRWGGLDGRRELVRRLGHSSSSVFLQIDNPGRYPGFGGDCGVIWLDLRFTRSSTRAEISGEVCKRSRAFFKASKPVLEELEHY